MAHPVKNLENAINSIRDLSTDTLVYDTGMFFMTITINNDRDVATISGSYVDDNIESNITLEEIKILDNNFSRLICSIIPDLYDAVLETRR